MLTPQISQINDRGHRRVGSLNKQSDQIETFTSKTLRFN
jgi:hypothetical protein